MTIFPALRVICTWVGPYPVMITSPVTAVPVPEPALTGADAAAAAPPADPAELPEPAADVPGVPAVPDVPLTPAAAVEPMWVRNDSSMTSPAMVPPRASTTRRIGFLRSVWRFEAGAAGRTQNSNDSWWIWARGTPAASSAATAESVIQAGPHT